MAPCLIRTRALFSDLLLQISLVLHGCKPTESGGTLGCFVVIQLRQLATPEICAKNDIAKADAANALLETQLENGYISSGDTVDVLVPDDNDENYRERIEEVGRRIIAKTKRTNYRGAADIYQAAIDEILEKIELSPEKSKLLIIDSTMNIALEGMRQVVKKNIETIGLDLKRISELEDIIVKLKFNENSKGKELADKFIRDCDELRDYQATLPKHYPNVGMHTN